MTQYRPLAIITHPQYLAHDTGGGEHPECADRLRVIHRQLGKSLLAPFISERVAMKATRQDILAYHEESYLFRLEETALRGQTYIDHRDNQICFESFEAILLSAGGGLTGIDLLEEQGPDLSFCCVRPPGHHAEKAAALGFCFINNAAVAARYWQRCHGRQKIAIIDWDAHHGNGIQDAFEDDPDVFYISIHEHPTFSFPGTGYAEEKGLGAGVGATLNIPLPPGADDALFLHVLERYVEPALDVFRPERLIVAAGFDGHVLDDMSGLSYSTELFGVIGERMSALAGKHCEGKVLSILEGGYHLDSLAAGVERYLLGLAGMRVKE
ncbi:MAG: histone deacetylase [Deltaproteobacteria bacterium]|nr:histone deacetylase [Deltaproteobacteria bacterium]